jgi:Cytosine/adenosine deaminases
VRLKLRCIYFGAYDDQKGSLESVMKIYNKKGFFVPEIYGGINELECMNLIKNFFKEKRS